MAAGAWFLWQQNSIVSRQTDVICDRLPAVFDGFRIVQLSDQHGKKFGQDSAYLLRKVAALRPDLIAVTGDLMDRAGQMKMVPAVARGLAGLAPTYYVTGNHERTACDVNDLEDLLRSCGVRVLNNDYDILEKGGKTLAVAGLDDLEVYENPDAGPELRQKIDADFVILLSHRDNVEEYASWNYDLILCGHGHGGIFRIPILDRGLVASDNTLFPCYDGGLYPLENGNACFVSRGLGSNTTPFHAFRLFNRPDLPLLVLRSAADDSKDS